MALTPSIVASWTDLKAVYEWAKLTAPEQAAVNAALGDATGGEAPEIIGMIKEAEFDTMIDGLRFGEGEVAPTILQKGRLRLVGLACRTAIGSPAVAAPAEPTPEVQQVLDGVTKLTAALAGKPATAAAGTGTGGTINLKQIVSQASEDTVTKLTREHLDEYYAEYRKIFSRDPGQDEECSVEQLTGLKALITADVTPYVDFAVWAPHHLRLLRKVRLQGLQLHADGTLHTVELVGPPDIHAWTRSYKLLLSGLIGFGAVALGNLLDYADKVKEYHERYGSTTWAILYQADVRCRQEHMERARRRLERAAAEATAAGKQPAESFDTAKPWDGVWAAVIRDVDFWRREFEEPAILVLSRSGRLQDLVSGDTPTGGAALSAESSQLPQRQSGARPEKRQRAQKGEETGAAQQSSKVHRVASGVFTHNRRNQPLCADFQQGRCQRGVGSACPVNQGQMHQCNKCLDVRHGGAECQQTPRPPSGKKGKGKGKGAKGQWQ